MNVEMHTLWVELERLGDKYMWEGIKKSRLITSFLLGHI